MNLDKRLSTYAVLSTRLSLLSNVQLMTLLDKAQPLGVSIGGVTSLLEINDTLVFVKRIPLTDIENEPHNILSTANLFNLPTYCQYGIGSPGFGVWRELAAHVMSTNWVIAGECSNFPLMYHWRILPAPESAPNETLERDSAYLNGFAEVRARLQAMQNVSNSLVIFMEYFPHNVHQWFTQATSNDNETATAACTMVEKNLKTITSFINSRGMLHFDAHFWNILTDGEQLYFSDFGLAISSEFSLSNDEKAFFKQHHRYDQCYTLTHLVKWLLIELFGEENWWAVLHECAKGNVQETVPPGISAVITRYAPICTVMTNFFETLKLAPATTPYPVDELERLCDGIQ